MELELSQLDLRYAGLGIRDGQRTGRLVASMSTSGQQAAVLVVRDDDEYVLVDGYARVEALHKLACDLVKAAVLELSQADALIVGYRLDNVRARSVLEEAWLLRELRDAHGMSPTELARKLDRSDSCVSRRLGLVGALPESVQVAVRDGRR
jgi:ParB/RepB/Spo0J family partition protein